MIQIRGLESIASIFAYIISIHWNIWESLPDYCKIFFAIALIILFAQGLISVDIKR